MAKKNVSIPNYPKKDGDRTIYVRYPVQVTEAIQKKLVAPPSLGTWVAVNVVADGYMIIPNATAYHYEKDCAKACDISNQFQGWSKDEADAIISQSMENSI